MLDPFQFAQTPAGTRMNARIESNTRSPDRPGAATGRALALRVLEFLGEHALSPLPVNYAVAYEYLVASSTALNERLDVYLSEGRPLDELLMRELYDEYLVHEQFRSLRGIGGNLQQIVENVLGNIAEADRNAAGFGATMEHSIVRLGDEARAAVVRAIATDLLVATRKARSGNEALRSSLASADTESRQLRHELERHRREAMIDPLTGLLNRRGLEQRLEDVLGAGTDTPVAMVMLDIDHFKRINDSYGHAIGDVVIRHVADTVRKSTRGEDLAVRYGGEEFIVVLPDTPLKGAVRVAETIRTRIERLRLTRRQDQLSVTPFTVSIGVAMFRSGEKFEDFFVRADRALYAAKQGGRNRVMMDA